MSVKDTFGRIAAQYAAYRPEYPPALADALAQRAPTRALAWEAGCGSGQLSTLLGDRFERVVATDASAEQIAVARPHPRVEYGVAPAARSGLVPASADLCVVPEAPDDYFDTLIGGYLAAGRASTGQVGAARTHLIGARDLHVFAVAWMETRWGEASGAR